MKKSIQIFSILVVMFMSNSANVFSARLILDAPTDASTNGEPFSVTISVDSEGEALSAISGVLSFPSGVFDIQSVTTRSSIVSLWVSQPKISAKEIIGDRVRIPFEGIIPGGYTGVRSPYYQGVRPGLVFIITLLPKKASIANISLEDIKFHLFNAEGTMVKVEPVTSLVTIPTQSIVYSTVTRDLALTYSTTLDVNLLRDPLIANNAWYLSVVEDESTRPISRIYISETGEYSSDEVSENEWKEVKNMYIVKNQSRTKYLHVKILYENNTYMIKTIAPVENSPSIFYSSRILISILCAIIIGFVLYLYVKKNKVLSTSILLQKKKSKTKK